MCEKLKIAYKINTNKHDFDNRRYTNILLSRGKPVSNHTNCYKVCFYYNTIVNNNLNVFLSPH